MWSWFRDLDRLLRGEATRLSALRRGTIELQVGGVSMAAILLGAFFGLCMGVFGLFRKTGPNYTQMVASMIKVPLLFLLTLLVTLPSLYVFNALVGSRLAAGSVVRLLVAAIAVTLAVLASFGLIVAFFSVSTTSYPFILLLNVAVYTVAGVIGLKYVLQTLHRLTIAQTPEEPAAPPALADQAVVAADASAQPPAIEPTAEPSAISAPASPSEAITPTPAESVAPAPVPPPPIVAPQAGWASAYRAAPALGKVQPAAVGALDRVDDRALGPNVKLVFRIWVVVFALVGAQMGWVLRPFIGSPERPFAWFRTRESSFFEAIYWAVRHLFG